MLKNNNFRVKNLYNYKCDLHKCDLDKCDLDKCDLDKCDLDKCDLDKCELDKCKSNCNCNCLVLDKLEENLTKNIKSLHVLDGSIIDSQNFFENLPESLEFLEIFNLNFDLTNLPIGLKKLYVVSYKKFNVKVPFDCEYTERIMNYDPFVEWSSEIGHALISDITLEIGGHYHSSISSEYLRIWKKLKDTETDDKTHTGKPLDKRTKLVYELATYL